jgi:hypothetical protein
MPCLVEAARFPCCCPCGELDVQDMLIFAVAFCGQANASAVMIFAMRHSAFVCGSRLLSKKNEECRCLGSANVTEGLSL